MRISDWSSDVCSSDLFAARLMDMGLLPLAAYPDCHPGQVSASEREPGSTDGPGAKPHHGPGSRSLRSLVRGVNGSMWRGGLNRREEIQRSEERSVGEGGCSTCSTRWSPED